jgi:hypothetical protein
MTTKKADGVERVEGLPVIPGKPHTIESLVAVLAKHKKAHGISDYRIVKTTGMGVGQAAVRRLFRGYKGTTEAGRVPEPEVPGRITLRAALTIVHAMGLDLEVVLREPPA